MNKRIFLLLSQQTYLNFECSNNCFGFTTIFFFLNCVLHFRYKEWSVFQHKEWFLVENKMFTVHLERDFLKFIFQQKYYVGKTNE